jgi:hypothetical protein
MMPALFGAMAWLCGWQSLFAAVIALLQHQRVDAPALTGWDEAAAFLGAGRADATQRHRRLTA